MYFLMILFSTYMLNVIKVIKLMYGRKKWQSISWVSKLVHTSMQCSTTYSRISIELKYGYSTKPPVKCCYFLTIWWYISYQNHLRFLIRNKMLASQKKQLNHFSRLYKFVRRRQYLVQYIPTTNSYYMDKIYNVILRLDAYSSKYCRLGWQCSVTLIPNI